MSERLDLAEAALREAMGERLDGLTQPVVRNAARQILEAADTELPSIIGDGVSAGIREAIAEMRARQLVSLAEVPSADEPRVGYPSFDDQLSDFVPPPAAPRVTREMVVGTIANAHYNEWLPCALCGAGLPTFGGVRQSDANIEAHRAWHDRLERLLEAS